MNNDQIDYIVKKCENNLKENLGYQRFNKEIIAAETELKAKVDINIFNLYLRINDLSSEQNLIFVDELLKYV